ETAHRLLLGPRSCELGYSAPDRPEWSRNPSKRGAPLIEKYTRDALIFFATLDPFTTLSVFVALTAARPAAERRKIAFKATLYSALILGGSIAIGQVILAAMDISLAAFSVAGGIVLF